MNALNATIDILYQLVEQHGSRAFLLARFEGADVPVAPNIKLKYLPNSSAHVPNSVDVVDPTLGRGSWCRFILCADGAVLEVRTFVPNGDAVDRRWQRCVTDLICGAKTLPHVWLSKRLN